MTDDNTGRASAQTPGPDPAVQRLIDDARSAESDRRWSAAGNELLPTVVMWELLHDPDPYVRQSLAGNYGAPTALLERLLDLHPDLSDSVANNPNAPADLKERLPFWQHTHLSLLRYGESIGLTTDQTDALRARLDNEPAEEHPTLGEMVRWLGLRE